MFPAGWALNVANQFQTRTSDLRPFKGDAMVNSQGWTVNTNPQNCLVNSRIYPAPSLTANALVMGSIDYPAISSQVSDSFQQPGLWDAPKFDAGEFVSGAGSERPCLKRNSSVDCNVAKGIDLEFHL
ncbi:hypothetical protein F0562_029526 [Nyssa sinensis]|uniref:Uncharacterized protein n=1 Tax=Nyssa sinensis TaxID=561372 RepID=A0A5J5B329_9ASTE|nr:hypothetical protein F0562_029526 [Nyssa sinensis]